MDIFLPEFCLKNLNKANNDSLVKDCLCKHSKKCKICTQTNGLNSSSNMNLVEIHEKVIESGMYNFQGCKIPINEKIDIDFMDRMLGDYCDKEVLPLLRYGFPIEVDSSFDENLTFDIPKGFKNHAGARNFPEHMLSYLKKESSHNAILGPFKKCPFKSGMSVSPLNTVPKSTPNERRIILDMSFPKNGKGVNDFIDKDFYLNNEVDLIFPRIDDFIKLIKAKGQGCLLYKLDLRRAYRQISICPSSLNKVGFIWDKHLFFDTVLSMGLRSAAHICQRVSNAFAFMMFNFGFSCLNYLDDFAGAENEQNATFAFLLLRELFRKSGIEEAADKASPPSQIMVFLGVLFNSNSMTMEITSERLVEIRSLINDWLVKEFASLKEIQQLLGKLNFVGACVRSSRIFVNRILNWLRDCYATSSVKYKVPLEMKKDLVMWDELLSSYEGISLIDYGEFSQIDGVFSCDSCLTGSGGVFGNSFFHKEFPDFVLAQNLSISSLEMLTVVVCLKVWSKNLAKKRIRIYCDNMATCIVINSGKARCKFLQSCLREICLISSLNEFQVVAVHLNSEENRLADRLSRWHLDSEYVQDFLSLTSSVTMTEVSVDDSLFQLNSNW